MGLLATLRTSIKALRHRISKIVDLAMENRYMLEYIASQVEGSDSEMVDEELDVGLNNPTSSSGKIVITGENAMNVE